MVNVGSPVEFDKNEREPHIGTGSQTIEPADTEECIFEGAGHEGLHLLRREARRLGQDSDGRLRHVGEHLDRKLCRGAQPQRNDQRGETKNDRPIAERPDDHLVEHFSGKRYNRSHSDA